MIFFSISMIPVSFIKPFFMSFHVYYRKAISFINKRKITKEEDKAAISFFI